MLVRIPLKHCLRLVLNETDNYNADLNHNVHATLRQIAHLNPDRHTTLRQTVNCVRSPDMLSGVRTIPNAQLIT